jgi:flagellar motor protein MotB
MEESTLDYNFWPSFADLMLAIVFLLVLVFALLMSTAVLGSVNMKAIKKNQENLILEIQGQYGGNIITTETRSKISRNGNTDIEIYNDLQLQRILFRDNILFLSNEYELSQDGKNILLLIGEALKKRLNSFSKIQIEGHTDIRPTYRYKAGNIELGARRAISVFNLLKDELHIDPSENLISISSFGEYKPVMRNDTSRFSSDQLKKNNRTEEMQAKNRRIELLLFYKR